MRRPTCRAVALALALVGGLAEAFALPRTAAAQEATSTERPEYHLGAGKLSIVASAKLGRRRVIFQAAWSGAAGDMNPVFEGSTLRISGAPGEGDSGLIRLRASGWRRLSKGRGFLYSDPGQAAGGVRTVLLRTTKSGGRIKVLARKASWAYDLGQKALTTLDVTLMIGKARWCAVFPKPKTTSDVIQAKATQPPASCPCDKFDSTWQAIQSVIFERHGCTQATCHGASPGQGNLDLLPDVAYANLIGVFSELGQQNRVERGSRQDSFLWRKLAAATAGLPGVQGTPMPQGLPAISADELEALRLWIQYGAPETGVIQGTEDLLASCLPPAEPPKIEPAAPPAANAGVQFHAPPWTIPAEGEDEVCYATYSDIEAQVPPEFKVPCPDFWGGPTKTCFFYNETELTQEPNSHHSIIHIYRGKADVTDPGFAFVCHGGAQDGQACDPRVAGVCGDGGACYGKVKSSLACLTFGPADYNRGFDASGAGTDNAPSVGGSQQPFLRERFPGGVFGVYPTQAVWVWNSHAFNLFDTPTTNEQWYNVYFAGQSDRSYVLRGIFDAADIFVQNVPPFEEREYCRTVTFGQGTRIFSLSSHNHKRGRLFRVWGPGIAASCRSTRDNPGACTAETSKPILVTTQYNDPAQVRFETPLELDDPDPATRRLKFCAIYDNGKSNPTEVKRNSTSPVPPSFGTLAPGGPCLTTGGLKRDLGIACLDGPKKGQPCAGDDRACDSAPDKNDGVCDACPLFGGVTTEDEMFILIGNDYCVPGTPCEAGYTN